MTNDEEFSLVKLTVKPHFFGANDEGLCNSHHTAQIYKDSMYILGGVNTSNPNALEVWKFDLSIIKTLDLVFIKFL